MPETETPRSLRVGSAWQCDALGSDHTGPTIYRMKILFMTPRFPYPPHKGDKALAYHRLRTLGPRHEIVLLTLFERTAELDGLDALRPYCSAIHAIRLPRWRSYVNMLLLGPWSRNPLQVLYYRSTAFRRKLDQLLARERFDVVHAFMLRLAPYLEGMPAPRVLEMIDSMQLNMARTAERSRGLRRLLYAEEHRRIRSYERDAGRFAERLVFVSDIDRTAVPSERSIVLPLGVVASELPAPSPGRGGAPPVVVFSGNMGYAPNVDAATWFVSCCWSLVREAVPEAELWVVGGNLAPTVQGLAVRPGVKVTGFVPDMAAVLRKAQVAVAPMQSGSGMQFKVLEAMACGIPVVVTRLGLGAIGAEAGKDLLVADAPAEFAAAVIGLLREPDRARLLGLRGREYIQAHHTWERTADQMNALYTSLSAGAATPAQAGTDR